MITKEEKLLMADAERLNKAIAFALEKHRGQFRKSTFIPYIVHPLEVMEILRKMGADTDLVIAGVLHDTIEDTDATLDEICQKFGREVGELIASCSEDKTKSWDKRKQHTIDYLQNADVRIKMLALADKLSNMRAMEQDYRNTGDALWERFNAPAKKQAWYYSKVQDALYDLQFEPGCEAAYWEFVALFKDVFVKFYINPEENLLYQICLDGEAYVLSRETPMWILYEEAVSIQISADIDSGMAQPGFYKTHMDVSDATELSVKEAEFIEDMWVKQFNDSCKKDIADRSITLYTSKKRCIDAIFRHGSFALVCEDFGAECVSISGTREYEFAYTLGEEDTLFLISHIRLKHGFDKRIEEVLKAEFGTARGMSAFEELCGSLGIKRKFYSR